jgi:hypothetical protein
MAESNRVPIGTKKRRWGDSGASEWHWLASHRDRPDGLQGVMIWQLRGVDIIFPLAPAQPGLFCERWWGNEEIAGCGSSWLGVWFGI